MVLWEIQLYSMGSIDKLITRGPHLAISVYTHQYNSVYLYWSTYMWGVSMYQEDIEKHGRPQMNTAKLGWEILKYFTYLDPYPPGMTLLFGSFCCDQTISCHKLKLTDHALCSALPFRNHYQEQQPRCRCHGSFRFDCRMVCMLSWIKVSHIFSKSSKPSSEETRLGI